MNRSEYAADKLKTALACGVVLGTAVVFYYGLRDMNARDAALGAAPRYTIGTVTRTAYAVGPSPHNVVFFTYRVGDSFHTGDDSGRLLKVGTRCLVKFAAYNSTIHQFYNRIPIPDSIRTAPPDGWAAPPFPVPAGALDE